jgi:hypothetical protein
MPQFAECPGCGCQPSVWKQTFTPNWMVSCRDYNCRPEAEGPTKEDAIANWNHKYGEPANATH